MSVGCVYVIAFSDGTVKVGRSGNAATRRKAHASAARGFGIAITAMWESPRHIGWIENERELKRLARELGGKPNGEEYFQGVAFAALTAKARELPFPAPADMPPSRPVKPRRGRVGSLRKTPAWLEEEIRRFAHTCIPQGECTAEQALRTLTDHALRDQRIARLLVEGYVGDRLRGEILSAKRLAERENAA